MAIEKNPDFTYVRISISNFYFDWIMSVCLIEVDIYSKAGKRKSKIDPTKAFQQEAIPLYRHPVDEQRSFFFSDKPFLFLVFLSCPVLSCLPAERRVSHSFTHLLC